MEAYLNNLPPAQLVGILVALAKKHVGIENEILDLMKDQVSRKVYVSNLDYRTTSESLHRHYLIYGPIIEACVIFDKNIGRSRGFGFITFSDNTSADRAVAERFRLIEGRLAESSWALKRDKEPQGSSPIQSQPPNQSLPSNNMIQLAPPLNSMQNPHQQLHVQVHPNQSMQNNLQVNHNQQMQMQSNNNNMHIPVHVTSHVQNSAHMQQPVNVMYNNPQMNGNLYRHGSRGSVASVVSVGGRSSGTSVGSNSSGTKLMGHMYGIPTDPAFSVLPLHQNSNNSSFSSGITHPTNYFSQNQGQHYYPNVESGLGFIQSPPQNNYQPNNYRNDQYSYAEHSNLPNDTRRESNNYSVQNMRYYENQNVPGINDPVYFNSHSDANLVSTMVSSLQISSNQPSSDSVPDGKVDCIQDPVSTPKLSKERNY